MLHRRETTIQPTTPDRAHPFLDHSLGDPPLLLCTNNDAGWKLVFGQCLPLEHDIRGKLAIGYGAGEHDGESVLLITSSVDCHIALPLHCDGGPSQYVEGKVGLIGIPDPAEGIFMLSGKLDDVGVEALCLICHIR